MMGQVRFLRILWDDIPPGGLQPRNASLPHVESFNIQSSVTKWVVPEIMDKVVINEHPIKRGIECNEYWLLMRGGHTLQPFFEAQQGFFWCNPFHHQSLKGQFVYIGRLYGVILVDGFLL